MGILAQHLLMILGVFEPDALLVLEDTGIYQGADLAWAYRGTWNHCRPCWISYAGFRRIWAPYWVVERRLIMRVRSSQSVLVVKVEGGPGSTGDVIYLRVEERAVVSQTKHRE